MYTSDKRAGEDGFSSVSGAYLAAALGCALFGAVYECFSHGVCSPFMVCAFAFPLLLGALPFFLLRRAGRPFPGPLAADLIHAGVAALTIGSILRGVLDIYGTTSPLLALYWILGAALSAAGWLSSLLSGRGGPSDLSF